MRLEALGQGGKRPVPLCLVMPRASVHCWGVPWALVSSAGVCTGPWCALPECAPPGCAPGLGGCVEFVPCLCSTWMCPESPCALGLGPRRLQLPHSLLAQIPSKYLPVCWAPPCVNTGNPCPHGADLHGLCGSQTLLGLRVDQCASI